MLLINPEKQLWILQRELVAWTLPNFAGSLSSKMLGPSNRHKLWCISHVYAPCINTQNWGPVILHKHFIYSVHKLVICTSSIPLYTPPPSPLKSGYCAQPKDSCLAHPPQLLRAPPIYYPITCAPPSCLARPQLFFFLFLPRFSCEPPNFFSSQNF